jgi:hypothetical protein
LRERGRSRVFESDYGGRFPGPTERWPWSERETTKTPAMRQRGRSRISAPLTTGVFPGSLLERSRRDCSPKLGANRDVNPGMVGRCSGDEAVESIRFSGEGISTRPRHNLSRNAGTYTFPRFCFASEHFLARNYVENEPSDPERSLGRGEDVTPGMVREQVSSCAPHGRPARPTRNASDSPGRNRRGCLHSKSLPGGPKMSDSPGRV